MYRLMLMLASMCMVMSKGMPGELDASEVRDRLERLNVAAQERIAELEGMIEGSLQLRHIGKEFLPELQDLYDAALNAYNERIADLQTRFDNKKLGYEQSLEQKEAEIEEIESCIKNIDLKYAELRDKKIGLMLELEKLLQNPTLLSQKQAELENNKAEILENRSLIQALKEQNKAASKEARALKSKLGETNLCVIVGRLEKNIYEEDAHIYKDRGDPKLLDSRIETLNEELAEAIAEHKKAIEEVRTELADPDFILQEPNALLKTLKGDLDYVKEYCESWTYATYLKRCNDEKARLARQIQRHIDAAYSTEAAIHKQVRKLLAETNSKLERLLKKSDEHLASCQKALNDF